MTTREESPTPARVVERWASHAGRAVIFDFNGTLSDDEPLLFTLFSEMFREHLGWTLSTEDYYGRLAGRSDREIIELVLGQFGGDDPATVDRLLQERRVRYFALVEQRSPILDATLATVQLLVEARVPVGIVTGAQRPDVEHVLAHRELDSPFVAVVTAEDVTDGKPHPEGFLLAAEQMAVEPDAVLVLEDTVFGVRAAKAAGMQCIAVTGTTPAEQLARVADAVVDSITPDLFGVLRTSSATRGDA